MIKNAMTFKQISALLDVPVAELQFLNPSYKREVIPFITGENHYLRLPIDKIAVFTSNEDKIYAYVQYEESRRERPYESMLASRDSISSSASRVKYHRVRRGESLSEISNQYGVAMSDLKKWNNLRSSKAPKGKKLKIYTNEAVATNYRKVEKPDTISVKESTAIASTTAKVFKEEKVVSFKDVVKYHKVKKGDNLGEISDKYGVSVAEVKKWNHLKGNNISLGASLKIIKNERVVTTVRKEVKGNKSLDTKIETAVASNEVNEDIAQHPKDYYEVQRGDNLFSIAKKFNVRLEDLKKWNNLDDLNVQQGSKLALANTEEAAKDEEPKTETKIVEYKVKKGDNLGSIARKYNVAVADLKEWNEMEDNNVKLGASLIVSKKEVAINEQKLSKKEIAAANERDEVKLYYVKKGDSLFSIAKKYNVTASDIKKWNGIKSESLKPGMKLKING